MRNNETKPLSSHPIYTDEEERTFFLDCSIKFYLGCNMGITQWNLFHWCLIHWYFISLAIVPMSNFSTSYVRNQKKSLLKNKAAKTDRGIRKIKKWKVKKEKGKRKMWKIERLREFWDRGKIMSLINFLPTNLTKFLFFFLRGTGLHKCFLTPWPAYTKYFLCKKSHTISRTERNAER